MSEEAPNFESIKSVNPYGQEFWSARDLQPLLGYDKWQKFEQAIERAKTACEQTGNVVADHFTGAGKMIIAGKGAQRQVKDYNLSRFACYLIAQNGDPRKPEIATAQVYFAIATRQNELRELKEAQDHRLKLRLRLSENNKHLAEAAYNAGVLSQNFGIFKDAGYKGLYGGLGAAEIKQVKGIKANEDILDRMGASELAANDFLATQTHDKLVREGITGQTNAINTHHEVGTTVRKAIKEIGGQMPESLPAEPTVKPILDAKKRESKKIKPKENQPSLFGDEAEDKGK